MADTIGQYLKECREKQELTIEKLSEQTHIKVRLLRQIENDELDNLGGIGYAKSFVLSYGRAVKANEPKLLLLFDNIFANKQVKYYRVPANQPTKVLIPTSIFYIIILVLLIAFLSYITIRLHNEGKLSMPKLDKITDSLNFKELFKPSEKPEAEEITPEIEEPVVEKSINKSALYDTTDYSSDLIFEGKKTPLNKE